MNLEIEDRAAVVAGFAATFHVRLSVDPPNEQPPQGWTQWLQGHIPELEQCFPGVRARRLFATISIGNYLVLRERAVVRDLEYVQSPELPLERPLLRYIALDCPQGTDLARLRMVLFASPKVETHYPESGVLLPRCGHVTVPWICSEGHLEPAPEGIDALYAWHFAGGDGAGLRVVDVERGWGLFNTDLLDAGATIASGVNVSDNDAPFHGTAVLGILAASRNAMGTNGIASGVSSVRLVSIQRDQEVENAADAVLAAVSELRFGDILLLEVQARPDSLPFRPIEVERAVFEAIRFATALGVVVVEPAANGDCDLDRVGLSDLRGRPTLNRGNLSEFRDSGAIIVSASCRPPTQELCGSWNVGSRVDCHAWGDGILTLRIYRFRSPEVRRRWLTARLGTPGFLDLLLGEELFRDDRPRLTAPYSEFFNDTSAASAVIAGAALSVQGMAQAHLGYRFSPWQLRLILSDPANGTLPQVPQKGNIGVMPDLKKVVRSVLNIPADVYLRDWLGDTCESPCGRRMESPDILVLAQLPQEPQREFGEGGQREDDDLTRVNAQLAAGESCYVGLRLRNRGGREAMNVQADIYCAPAATLLVPSLWKKEECKVAGITLPLVPEADRLTVSGFLGTQVSALSTEPYRAWIAILHHPDDPGPEEEDFQKWDCFLKLLRTADNLGVRNLHAVPHATGEGEEDPNAWLELPFLAAAADDCKRVMRIEVLSRLPRDCRVWIDMPPEFCDLRQVSSVIVPCVFCSEDLVQLPVNPNGKHYFREMPLDPGQTPRLSLRIYVPPPLRRHAYRIAVRQICDGEEVGRVTWRLMPLH